MAPHNPDQIEVDRHLLELGSKIVPPLLNQGLLSGQHLLSMPSTGIDRRYFRIYFCVIHRDSYEPYPD